ncbi:hypothetical protein [Nocardioides donggukensis]|uniref:DMT family transporter n=1 Tax=Nocardioides donggukensis TaxID=2774019 RepID=A0A927K2I4_9ACTN|nr:hypothetical protein [Nocardioides donggukensis]MBD8869109.1 hypothetical protein [Nocardioides donggukensis]
MLTGLAAALAAAALFGVAAVLQAHRVRLLPQLQGGLGRFLVAGARDPVVLAVVAAYLGGFLLHAVAIVYLPLYLAQAAISLSMPITAITASRLLHEPLGWSRWLAVAAVTLGIVVLAVSSGDPGEPAAGTGLALAVWLLVAACVAAGVTLRRHPLWLGVASGTGYAGSAIAVRGIELRLSPAVLVTALAVPALGAVAFWLYSLALASTTVTPATAALIVMQTFVPALVGLALLGDGVRPGWWGGVAAGTALAVAGAVRLGDRAAPP